MGHNGGFNPFRDANGEFALRAGSPGRPRVGGPAAWPALPRGGMNAMIRRAAGRGPNGTMRNEDVRGWYNDQVSQIPALNDHWKSLGMTAENRARMAHKIRHDARISARAAMQDRAAVADIRGRDQQKYGHPDGPTFDHLVADWKKRGVDGDEVFESIIGGSARTNAEVNAKFAKKGAAA